MSQNNSFCSTHRVYLYSRGRVGYYTKRFLHYVHRIFSAYIYAKISRFEVKIVRLLVNKQLWVTGVVLVLDMGGRHCSVETGPQSAEPLINEISPCLPKVSRTFAEGQAA